MTSDSITVLVERALPVWNRALDALAADPGPLAAGLCERWLENASTLAPDGMPNMPGISEEYGWAAALELYLASLRMADTRTATLFSAFRRACALIDDNGRHDVWLGDILALRRLPPKALEGGDLDGGWNGEGLGLVLENAEYFSKKIPAPDEDSYAYYDRIYALLTNALVSEIVEAESPGWVQSQYQSGRRLLPPDAHSIFRQAARAATSVRNWSAESQNKYRDMRETWGTRIADLADAITLLNPKLEELGIPDLLSGRAAALNVDAFEHELARYFDDSFCRLLMADPRESPRNARLLAALKKLGATTSLYVDHLTVQATLWGGQKEDPLSEHESPDSLFVKAEDGCWQMSESARQRFAQLRNVA
jgi:hypothetical protein